ncbi:ATP-binding cassette domain-containing protein [Roseibaca sp. Y0-43]|uniref:thiamine ABC transporter ATP-binding protein n=1 Tax=Roseibaca sp. Y0-43 TaxID=2816854 RepID=UPI001D0CC14C|nr:ATP-binding cassette domain-containing protein [Roseibaca sp. Y0-43]MCC1480911.1 ATP-binding cassette domain-containing protein [Roseibaca sp. Y0-43]
MLRLEDVRISQGDFHLRADFGLEAGARVAVIGPSGAGKSTLMGAIAGFVPHAGRVTWQGRALAHDPGARPVSILFQDNNLFPHLTAFENVALGLKPSLRLSKEESLRVADALVRVGLAGLDNRRPAELSGGQQSRVALARTLIRARPLLLLDEPFAALGPALKADMLALVAEIATETGATMLMVSHDVADARAICGQTVLVADGVARPPKPTAALLDNPPPELRAYLG